MIKLYYDLFTDNIVEGRKLKKDEIICCQEYRIYAYDILNTTLEPIMYVKDCFDTNELNFYNRFVYVGQYEA